MFACHSTARNHKNFWSFFEAIFKRTQYLRNRYHTFLFEFWSGFYTKMWSLVNYENHYNLTNMFLPNPTSNRSLSYKSFIFFLLALDCIVLDVWATSYHHSHAKILFSYTHINHHQYTQTTPSNLKSQNTSV